MRKQKLSPERAFAAMSIFLEGYARRTSDGDLRALLGDIQLNAADGLPLDPAVWSDWIEAVERALAEKTRAEELTSAR